MKSSSVLVEGTDGRNMAQAALVTNDNPIKAVEVKSDSVFVDGLDGRNMNQEAQVTNDNSGSMRKTDNEKDQFLGKGVNMSMVFCRGCGKEIHNTAPTCPHCGALQQAAQQNLSPDAKLMLTLESKKKKGWVAAVLNWFIPGAGYMYCDRWILGAIVLIIAVGVAIATAGIGLIPLAVILIIDGFLSAARYNKKLMAELLAEQSKAS